MIRPRRSVLYVPGSNARALEKARAVPADALILDLEDAVAPEAKPEARALVASLVSARVFARREVVVRINALDTEWGRADLDAAAACGPDAILFPKIASARDLMNANAEIARRDGANGIALWTMMERPQAFLAAHEIASAAPATRLAALVAGTNDLSKELRIPQLPGREALLASLSLCVLAARAAGVSAIDGVYNDIQNADGFVAVCRQGAQLGFAGKTVIHPSQVTVANEVFAPDPAEVAWSRKIIAAFDAPEHRGKGVIQLEGRMVELLHAEQARKLVAVADAIAHRGSGEEP